MIASTNYANCVSILQVGDIHYPDFKDATSAVDIKSDPIGARPILAPKGRLFEEAIRLLLSQANQNIDGIVFVGDLTTGGDEIGYTEIAQKLSNDILPQFFSRAQFGSHVVIVPGNHDIDWPACIAPRIGEDDLLEKFRPFNDILRRLGITNFPYSAPCSITLGGSNVVNVLAINTCLGCGELRLFPDDVKTEVRKALNGALQRRGITGHIAKIDLEILTERLDAPLISKETLSQIDEVLFKQGDLESSCFNVVVGHHNLLPQLVPRVAPFSELMNAGELRAILAKKEQPVVYLHGHIHSDPIEIVINQQNKSGGVFAISAPPFQHGFNKITFWFDAAHRPLGTEVTPYRLDESGLRQRYQSIKLPYNFGPSRLSRMSPLARKILGSLGSKQKAAYFQDICTMHPNETENQVYHALCELAWVEAVQIDNQQERPEQWYLRFSI